jgi:antirestriction protein
MRYYYKSKDGTGFLNLRTPLNEDELNDYIEITEEEFVSHCNNSTLTKEEIKQKEIYTYKQYLLNTDYIVIKMAEIMSDGGSVEELKERYKDELSKRKEYREKINELENS